MDFGRADRPEQVAHRLPPDHVFNRRVLGSCKSDCKVFVGLPIWANPKWVTRLYPKGTAPRDFLRAYAAKLPTVEVNSTFYHSPTLEQVDRWRDSVPSTFRFLPKAPQAITHARSDLDADIARYARVIEGLGETLGPTFVQLPPSVGPAEKRVAFEILKRFPRELPMCVELRHGGWFSNRDLSARLFDWLHTIGCGLVITDTSARRDVLHMAITAPNVIVRFAGNQLHASDYERLDAWVDRIERWLAAGGLEALYFVIHQPDEILGVTLQQYLVDAVNARCGLGLARCELQTSPQLALLR